MASCRLPLEIPDTIIDHLHNDRKSLCACSLTCKDWIHKSRTHIFSNIIIGLYNVDKRLPKFLNVIQSSTTPGRYVRSLTLWFQFRDDSLTPKPPALPILADHLPRVQRLQLTGIKWDMLDTAARTAILSGFQSVRDFTLDGGHFSTFTEILELISSFPALDSLDCTGEFVVTNPGDLPGHLKPPSLRKLQLECCKTSQIMAWFMSGEYECDISTLVVSITTADELKDVFKFLKALGPALKHLHLIVRSTSKLPPWDIDVKVVDLTQNTSLFSLRISREFHETKRTTNAYVEYLNYIPKLLSQIRSHHVESLWIDLQINGQIKAENLDARAWSAIEHILSHSRFSHLRDVTFFNCSSEVKVESLRTHVNRQMRNLAIRDILHFHEGFA